MHLWYNNLHWYNLHVLKYLDTKHLCVKKELWTEEKHAKTQAARDPSQFTPFSLPHLILFLLYINLFFFELFSVDDSVFFFFFTYLFPSSSFLLMIKYYLFVYFVDVNFFFFLSWNLESVTCPWDSFVKRKFCRCISVCTNFIAQVLCTNWVLPL